jgi:predicted transglutaminase-like protease
MNAKLDWKHIICIFGIIAIIIGAIDPLEGSLLVVLGSTLLGLSTYLKHDRHWKIFFISTMLIFMGVIFLFYFSSLGGFGGKSTLSMWWGLHILPYTIGWLLAIVTLIVRAVNNYRQALKHSSKLR